ncbi:MAG: hypothetical protein ACK5MN_08820 [Lachnospiraceae bacterium]
MAGQEKVKNCKVKQLEHVDMIVGILKLQLTQNEVRQEGVIIELNCTLTAQECEEIRAIMELDHWKISFLEGLLRSQAFFCFDVSESCK